MDEILKDLEFCFAYIDDILVFSCSPQEHDQHLHTLYTQLQKYGILLNSCKCVFHVPKISFLGYKISSMGSQPLPERVTDLQACPPSQDLQPTPTFLGDAKFQSAFPPSCSLLPSPSS
jgi:hypothetical protein